MNARRGSTCYTCRCRSNSAWLAEIVFPKSIEKRKCRDAGPGRKSSPPAPLQNRKERRFWRGGANRANAWGCSPLRNTQKTGTAVSLSRRDCIERSSRTGKWMVWSVNPEPPALSLFQLEYIYSNTPIILLEQYVKLYKEILNGLKIPLLLLDNRQTKEYNLDRLDVGGKNDRYRMAVAGGEEPF